MQRYKMSAMQAALDGLDDATFNLIMEMQLEDVISIKRQDVNGGLASPRNPKVIQMFAEELLQYQDDPRPHVNPPSPTKNGAKNANVKQKKFECSACGDNVLAGAAWTAPCNHHYCVECLENLHRLSLTDETLYPPKCCRLEMPWNDVRPRINPQLARSFEGKKEELDTDAGRRTYCSSAASARFIGPSNIKGDRATCPQCSRVTCTMCKAAYHGGDCPADESLRQTLQLAANQGWKRCTRCRTVVELTHGCNHITYVFFSLPQNSTAADPPTDVGARAAMSFAIHVSLPGGHAAAICGLSNGFWLVMAIIIELLLWNKGPAGRDTRSRSRSR